MKLRDDCDLKKFLERLKLLEHIQKNSTCSVREIKSEFNINKSGLYRKIDEWASEGLLLKDYGCIEKHFYSHFVVRKTPQLKIELLSLYDELINLFSKKYKEIADFVKSLGTNKKKLKINVIE
ncbi:hypothetical protein LCGC14_0493070 [marine sediment metagenome]|uniref:Helix-turn-helix type 11 domain-containing protein n=1 Tax=marine sediment metagenome TaxID=412755 RepID=A0A0F9SBB1_9ZZZZ